MRNEIIQYRKDELSDLAETISEYYFHNGAINPEVVANKNNVTFSYGNYKNAFDGLLEHKFGRFHIFINEFRVGDKSRGRSRFTFGHELGHYFIDEHRNALKHGLVPYHASFNRLLTQNLAEKEADFFSSCFLMPGKRFKEQCAKMPLSSKLITDLSKTFQTSITATIFRYFELDLFPMFIVYSKDSIIKWYFKSEDFLFKYPPKYGSKVPASSVAGEYFYENVEYPNNEETIFPDDWFSDYYIHKNLQLYEKCYYLKYNNSVLSMIWVKQ